MSSLDGEGDDDEKDDPEEDAEVVELFPVVSWLVCELNDCLMASRLSRRPFLDFLLLEGGQIELREDFRGDLWGDVASLEVDEKSKSILLLSSRTSEVEEEGVRGRG